MSRKKLAAKVLTVVKQQQPIRAAQIAKIINEDTDRQLKRKDINSVLYSELRTKVYQDEEYNWYLKGNNTIKGTKNTEAEKNPILKNEIVSNANNQKLNAEERDNLQVSKSNINILEHESIFKKNYENLKIEKKPQTLLARLAYYYSECLSFERDTEVSVYSVSKFEAPEYVQLNSLPTSNNFNECWDQEDVRKLILKTKRSQSNKKLYLGYPVFVRPTPKGNYIKLEPLFLFSFDLENNKDSPIMLSNESPRINLAGFKGYAEESGNLFDDLIQLQHELGLDRDLTDLPEIDDLVLNLRKQKPLWPWVGEIDPLKLDQTLLSEVSAAGIYNSAILVSGEGSKFTKGLEKELEQLKNISNNEDYRYSVLAEMLGLVESRNEDKEVDIIEAIQLNYEQKIAVKSIFNNGLTVVTGPPGTGKSQVVTAMLINAAHHGWKVLFTSKNNKAVDVVEHRVNGLCQQPFVLRLGAKELQMSLAEKLSQLLSSQKSKESLSNYERLNEKHDFLSSELKELFGLMEKIIGLRNEIDNIDQGLERVKKKLPKQFFEQDNKELLIKINGFEKKLGSLNKRIIKSKASKLYQFYWALYSRLKKSSINTLIKNIQDFFDHNGLVMIQSSISVEESYSAIKDLKQIVEDINKYNRLKQQIKNLRSFEDLCLAYQDIHSELVETDSDLWKNWLALISYRMNITQRKTLGDYVSILKYIVDANSSGETINRKTWKDYYRLTEEVAPLLPVWAVTSLSANGRLPLEAGIFDLVIIDEASQCDIASVIPLLYRAKRAVILGDPNQLRHITTLSGKQDLQLIEKHNLNDHITWGYAKNSCFDLAASVSKNVITLREHHRSHQDIIEFSNQVYYNGVLRVATKTENLRRLKKGLETNVEWHSVAGKVERFRGSGACNEQEAQAVFDYVEDLVKNRSYKGTIGIVTPFRGQVTLIRELFAKSPDMTKYLVDSELLIDTVHKFQGDEKDIIIFSSVVSKGIASSSLSFLRSQGNLFNVAITRARSHLTVIGDQATCKNSGVSYLASFVDYVESLKVKNTKENLLESKLSSEYPQVAYDPNTVSDWEVKFYKAMFKAGLRPIPQYKEDKYRLDFAIFDGHRKLNIEIDGEKYHRDWDGNLILEDQVRNDRLRELGWAVKRFWVFQVRDEEDLCIQEIEEWLAKGKRNSA